MTPEKRIDYTHTVRNERYYLDRLATSLWKNDQAVFIERDGKPILCGIDLVDCEVRAILDILNGPLNKARMHRVMKAREDA
jgi:hypothetical protein